MKFKKSPRNGNLLVEVEPEDTRLISNLNGPITALKEILVPIDFSDCSKHALRYAMAFAKQFKARITLLSIVNDSHTTFESANAEFLADIESRKQRSSDELSRLAKSQLNGIASNVLVRTGRPFEQIVKAARDLNMDLVVISTHGHMGSLRGDLGSTAERVVRYAPCPVIVVREREREFAPPV